MQQQQPVLEQYFSIFETKREHAILSLPASELVTSEGIARFVSVYQPLLKGFYPTVTATFFCSYLASLSAGVQYCLSIENRALEVSLDQVTVEIIPEPTYYRIGFIVPQNNLQAAPEDEEARRQWRAQILTRYYDQTANALVQAFATGTGINPGQLWGQFPGIFDYFMETLLGMSEVQHRHQHLQEDYHFLTQELDPQVFGRKKNPFQLKARFIEALMDPNKSVRIRGSCCLYFQTQEGEYCYNCPRISEEGRALKKQRFQTVSSH